MSNVSFQYGGKRGKKFRLSVNDEYLVVRTHGRAPLDQSALSSKALRTLREYESVTRFEEAGVEILRCKARARRSALRDEARRALKREKEIRFAGRVLADRRSKEPTIYTENLFVKLVDDLKPTACKKLLRQQGVTIKREIEYCRNAYFVDTPEGTGQKVFAVAAALLAEENVELCHPELIRQVSYRGAFPQQWHLKKTTISGSVVDQHANVVAAWSLSEGEGITIAVIDTGTDIDHEEFAGSNKVVAPRDVTRGTNDARPRFSNENHGTACAGVACASGSHGASGVAPKARLMPIRLMSDLGSQAEADAFFWAANNGADVISCSWGPTDGDFLDPNDPLHNQLVALPDSTRLAIEFAVTQGRNGKGCVITWAAGNGNESVENDGYASFDKVISVAACDDKGKKAPYSDFGVSNWCCFPSNHFFASATPGIWTTDQSGSPGYNNGNVNRGDAAGNYTNSFGGTSSACPGAAGVAALVLARNPELRWDQVKQILKECCDKIDTAGGNYDANGHSDLYGYGRLNAKKAVTLALPPQPNYIALHSAIQDVGIKDLKTSKLTVAVGDTKPIKTVQIEVDIEHTWIGDLVVKVIPPATTGVGPVTLHDKTGGSTNNIKQTFDTASTPDLAGLAGKDPSGVWTLRVKDTQNQDVGKIVSFSVRLGL